MTSSYAFPDDLIVKSSDLFLFLIAFDPSVILMFFDTLFIFKLLSSLILDHSTLPALVLSSLLKVFLSDKCKNHLRFFPCLHQSPGIQFFLPNGLFLWFSETILSQVTAGWKLQSDTSRCRLLHTESRQLPIFHPFHSHSHYSGWGS